jgi:hypothetical protein
MGGVVLVFCIVISEMRTKLLLGKLVDRQQLEDLSVDGRIV